MKSNGSSDPEVLRRIYDNIAETYDHTRGQTAFLRRLDLAERKTISRFCRNANLVLEVGAGTGRLTNELLNTANHVVATDISPKMLRVLQTKYCDEARLTTQLCNVYDLQTVVGYGQYDALVSFRTVPHLRNLGTALKIFRKAVRPGGLIIVDFWNRHSYVYLRKRNSGVYNNYVTYKEVISIASGAGLKDIFVEYAGFVGPGDTSMEFLRWTPLRRFAYSLIAVCRTPE